LHSREIVVIVSSYTIVYENFNVFIYDCGEIKLIWKQKLRSLQAGTFFIVFIDAEWHIDYCKANIYRFLYFEETVYYYSYLKEN